MVDPNSPARDEPDGDSSGPTDSSSHHPAADDPDAAGEHTSGSGLSPHLTTDEIFAQMVAGLDDVDAIPGSSPSERREPDPQQEAPSDAGSKPKDANDSWNFPTAPWVQGSGPRDRVVTPEVAELEELEQRFTPPDPRDVLSKDPLVNLAWAAVVAAPLAILMSLLFWPDAPTIVVPLCGAVFLAGLAALVWRMPATRNTSDDDPGAVV